MDPTISSDQLHTLFAYLPWALGIAIVLVAYFALRGQDAKAVPIGQTFACAKCGRRGHRDHMVPATHAGAVSWYCARCANH